MVSKSVYMSPGGVWWPSGIAKPPKVSKQTINNYFNENLFGSGDSFGPNGPVLGPVCPVYVLGFHNVLNKSHFDAQRRTVNTQAVRALVGEAIGPQGARALCSRRQYGISASQKNSPQGKQNKSLKRTYNTAEKHCKYLNIYIYIYIYTLMDSPTSFSKHMKGTTK